MIFSRQEKVGYVLLFCSPGEFFVKFTNGSECIKIQKTSYYDQAPNKNEVFSKANFIVEYNSDYVLCEVLEDLKYDEVFCQISLCNSNIKLKVDYRRLICLNYNEIVNELNCVNLKLNDFSPIFPNAWSSVLISKLKKLLTFNKFIIKYKSVNPDPSDGKYPVDILRILDRKSVVEDLVDGKTAMSGSKYFDNVLDSHITQIFNVKKSRGVRYRISSPLAKEKPVSRNKTSPSKKLNMEAEPFTPKNNSLVNNSTDEISNLLKLVNLSSVSPSENHVTLNSKPGHFTTDIVNMLAEMYKDQPSKVDNYPATPINSYSIISNSGGVYFSPPTTLQFPNDSYNEHFSPNFSRTPNIISSPNTCKDPNTKTVTHSSIPNPFPIYPNANSSTIDPGSKMSQSSQESFTDHQRKSLNESFIFDNDNMQLIEVASIPLPPEPIDSTSNFNPEISHYDDKNLSSFPVTANSTNLSESVIPSEDHYKLSTSSLNQDQCCQINSNSEIPKETEVVAISATNSKSISKMGRFNSDITFSTPFSSQAMGVMNSLNKPWRFPPGARLITNHCGIYNVRPVFPLFFPLPNSSNIQVNNLFPFYSNPPPPITVNNYFTSPDKRPVNCFINTNNLLINKTEFDQFGPIENTAESSFSNVLETSVADQAAQIK